MADQTLDSAYTGDQLDSAYTTRPLTADTWGDFADLVEANNGVWGGCWCMGFHPEGVGKGRSASQNRDAKRAHVREGTVHQILVYDGDECVGWCQYGPPAELPTLKNSRAYDAGLTDLPDWRIGCMFTGKGHRRRGVARTAVTPPWPRSRKPAAGLSRHTPNRSMVENRSAAAISTPARRTCSRSSASSVTDGSPSGAG